MLFDLFATASICLSPMLAALPWHRAQLLAPTRGCFVTVGGVTAWWVPDCDIVLKF